MPPLKIDTGLEYKFKAVTFVEALRASSDWNACARVVR